MSNYNRNGQKRGGRNQMNNENRPNFDNQRNGNRVQVRKIPSLKIINGNNPQSGRPVKILTARKANQQQTNGRAAKIAKNLQHMKLAAQKKKQAQEHYYGQGKSPLVRTGGQGQSQGNKQSQNNRSSIQHRLGKNNTTVNNNNNNNNNRKRFVPNVKQAKMNRIQQVYNRKNRIQKNGQVVIQRRGNQNQGVKTVSLLTGEVKYLRPLRRSTKVVSTIRPTNYTVRVENPAVNFRSDNGFKGMVYKHHVQSDLNPTLQQEIRSIQKNTALSLHIANVPAVDAKVYVNTTGTTLHERFSMI